LYELFITLPLLVLRTIWSSPITVNKT